MLIIGVVTALLMVGARESAAVNGVLVAVKIVALAVFVAVAAPHFNPANFHPFMPAGLATEAGGVRMGVLPAASIVFFAFYGFDAISTAAEETRRPARDLPLGILGSMVVCTAIYVIVAAVAVGATRYDAFVASPEPLAFILRSVGHGGVAQAIGAAAVVALPTVILAFLFGQSRIFFVMARDGLLPAGLARVDARSGAPERMTVATAVLVAILAGLAPLGAIASLANAGTLTAFAAVSLCLLVLRRREPDRPRRFRAPLAWLVAPAAILGCVYLFWNLQAKTQAFFAAWNAFGLVCYFAWRAARSRLAPATAERLARGAASIPAAS